MDAMKIKEIPKLENRLASTDDTVMHLQSRVLSLEDQLRRVDLFANKLKETSRNKWTELETFIEEVDKFARRPVDYYDKINEAQIKLTTDLNKQMENLQ